MPPVYTEPQKVEGDCVPTYYLEYRLAGGSTASQSQNVVFVHEEVPDSFAQGMREIEEGLTIDFDSALRNPPQEV